MGLGDAKNDIKMLFFIVNSIIGLLAGLLTFSFGVAMGVADGMQSKAGAAVALLVIGLVIAGVAALGYVGASRQNRIMLFTYTGVMVLAVVGDIVGMALLRPWGARGSGGYQSSPSSPYAITLAYMTFHLGLSVLAVVLAAILAAHARKPDQHDQATVLSPPPTQPHTPPWHNACNPVC